MFDVIKPFIETIDNDTHKDKLLGLLQWILESYPNLELAYKWKQPMLLDHGVFIIGFSVSKKHFAVAPEYYAMIKFSDDIDESNYDRSKMLFRITWDQPIDYALFKKIIDFKINDRLNEKRFWK